MSDHTNPPYGGQPGGGTPGGNGPYGGQPGPGHPGANQPGPNQPGPYGPPAGQPGSYGPPAGQPGSYGPGQPGQPGPYGPPAGQPGSYGPPQGQPNPYGQGAPGQYGQPGQYGPGPGQPGGPGQYGPGAGQPGGPGQYGGASGTPYGQMEQGGFGPGGPGGPHLQQWQPEPRKRRGKLVPIIAALAVFIVAGGGAAFAYSRLSGGGDQPEAVLPGNAVAFARVDLDPGAGQKVAALRFMMKFPSVKDKIGITSDNDDLRERLFEFVKKESGDDLADVDFKKDVDPWLGDRAGVVAVPAGEDRKPNPIVAVQIKDEGKAKAGLDKLFAKEDPEDRPGMAFNGDYVLLAEDQAAADKAVADGKNNPLANNAEFKKSMDELGEQGFASFWIDGKGMAELAKKELKQGNLKVTSGSFAAALRFDDQHVELKGVGHADTTATHAPMTGSASTTVKSLPTSTAAAIGIGSGDSLIGQVWAELQKLSGDEFNPSEMAKGFAEQYGLSLPNDIKVLLGKSFAVSLDKSTEGDPKVAAKSKTDPGKAAEVADKLLGIARKEGNFDVPIAKAQNSDTLVVATSQAYADEVLKDGGLGASEAFKQAVPDTDNAIVLAYVDFEALAGFAPRQLDNPDVKALKSAGMVARLTPDGKSDFTLRVVAK